ncbi:Intracellular distribution of mitochondria [Tilletia horrida]|nr:Intracellular distribution of mitochondria [Tilletia horrida]KAK0563065.1 Intracellular distribution of mitochondria [Tilletia horrida]
MAAEGHAEAGAAAGMNSDTPAAVASAVQADLAPAPNDSVRPSGEGPNPDEDAVEAAAQELESKQAQAPNGSKTAGAEQAEEEDEDTIAAAAAAAQMQPFEILIWFPARPLLPQHAIAAGLPDTPSPLRCAVTPSENLNDLRATIQDSPEGYWLGAFCFRLRTVTPSSKGSGASGSDKKKDKEEEVVTLGERLGEWTELSTVFEGIPTDQRQLAITHVEYNESDARTHVQRLRELLHSGYRDPLALGIDAGITVLDAVRHPAEWEKESNAAILSGAASGTVTKAGHAAGESGSDGEAPHKASGAALFGDFAGPAPTDGSTLPDLVPAHARPARYFPSSLRHLSVAAWSPPPHHLRIQAGHLIYLHVVTLEGETHFITACTRGFYVNRCTASKFDPSPRTLPKSNKPELASCSLFDVLCALSPLFLTNFAKLFNDPLSARDYYAAIPCSNCLPAFPWLAREIPGSSSQAITGNSSFLPGSTGVASSSSGSTLTVSPTAAGLSHIYDPLRSQSAYLITGATAPDQLEGTRDWNDEIQSTREIPRATLPERLVRERVLNRAFSDFVMAAVRAVPRVAAGMVPAMNPMDAPPAQMFIVNNLFISKGVDGVDLYPHLGGHEAAHVAVSKDVSGVRTLNALDIDGVCLLGTVVVDWMGERWVAQSVVPGLFRRKDEDDDEEEEAESGKTEVKEIANDEEKVDKNEEPAKAEKPSDGEAKPVNKAAEKKADLHEDTQVIYGGVEGPDVIRTHKGFHKMFAKVAAALHLALHKVADGEGVQHELWLSVESKGLRGADGRKYALDLARLNPVDVLWLEQDVDGAILGGQTQSADGEKAAGVSSYPHRMTLLRPELLEIFWDDSFRKWAREQIQKEPASGDAKDAKETPTIKENGEAAEEGEENKVDVREAETDAEAPKKASQPERVDPSKFQLAFNPDAFVEFRVPDPEALTSGEEDAEVEAKTKVVVLVKDEADPTVAAVRSAAKFLRDVALPRLVTDVATGIYSAADGAHLTQQMHTRGINVRYLGYLAQLTNPDAYTSSAEEAAALKAKLDADALKNAGPGYEGTLRCFESVVLQEMVVRAAKRLLRAFLRQVTYAEAANVISHFLNCLLGTAIEPKPAPVVHLSPLADGFEGGVYDDAVPSSTEDKADSRWSELTPESLRAQVLLEIRRRYRFELPAQFLERGLRKAQALRELSQRCGIQLKLQAYKFERASETSDLNGHADGEGKANGDSAAQHHSSDEGASTPTAAAAAANKKKSKKKKAASSVSDGFGFSTQTRPRITTFEPEDVLNLVPVIKDSAPKSTLAEEAFEAGRLSLGRGDRDLGVELLLEGINFHEQVYGVVHPEVSRCYSLFAMYVHHFTTLAAMENADRVRRAQAAGQDPNTVELAPTNEHLSISNAVRYQRMAVTISERTLGLDSPETVTQYLNLAILERAEGNHDASLQCLNRVLELWNLIYGPNHVEVVTVLSTIALTLQHARRMEASLKLYQASHSLALSLFGPDNIQVGNLTHELSQAYALVADLKTALQLAKESSRIFEARLGKDDQQTREAELYLNSLAASAVRHAKLEQEAKKREAKLAAMGIQVQPGLVNRAAQMRLHGQGSGASGAAAAAVASQGADAKKRVNGSASSGSASAGPSVDPSLSIDELVSYINSGSAGAAGGKGKGKSSAAAQSAKKTRR